MKSIAVVLAVMFAFSGVIYAFADEQNAFTPSAAKVPVQSASISTAPLLDSFMDKNDFELTASRVTDEGAMLSWSGNNMPIGYTVCKYNNVSKVWEEYASTNRNRIKISDLSAATSYRFCVINSASNELLGATIVKTALKRPKLRVEEKTSNKVVLSLGKVKENETVQIYRKTAGKDYKKIAEVTGKARYADKSLKSNTAYYYKAKKLSMKEDSVTKSRFSSTIRAKTAQVMGLPSVSGATKTYAYYTAVTARSSPQYKLLRSDKCTTDKKTGIRMYDGCYCVALGSYYGTKIGTKYRITFSNGNSINVILCDQKANRHTDSNHQYAVNNKDIVEFYVQRNMIPKGIRGDYGRLSQFSGKVVKIEKFTE